MYCLSTTLLYWDHPRLRGEHFVSTVHLNPIAGSPPPTRGTLKHKRVYRSLRGITPAYAGNTFITLFISVIPWDHPRLRGEHYPFA